MRLWQEEAIEKIDKLAKASSCYEQDGIPAVTKQATQSSRHLIEYLDIPVQDWKASTNEMGCYEIEFTTDKRYYSFTVMSAGGCAYHYYDLVANGRRQRDRGGANMPKITKFLVKLAISEWTEGQADRDILDGGLE